MYKGKQFQVKLNEMEFEWVNDGDEMGNWENIGTR